MKTIRGTIMAIDKLSFKIKYMSTDQKIGVLGGSHFDKLRGVFNTISNDLRYGTMFVALLSDDGFVCDFYYKNGYESMNVIPYYSVFSESTGIRNKVLGTEGIRICRCCGGIIHNGAAYTSGTWKRMLGREAYYCDDCYRYLYDHPEESDIDMRQADIKEHIYDYDGYRGFDESVIMAIESDSFMRKAGYKISFKESYTGFEDL